MEEHGKRFSLVYPERGAPARDSQRFRNRLAVYYWQHLHENHSNGILNALQQEAGIEVPYIMNFGYSIADVFKKGELRDVLDSITLVYQEVMRSGWKQLAEGWRHFVERALREENAGYSVDQHCGVHYFTMVVIQDLHRRGEQTALPQYVVHAAVED